MTNISIQSNYRVMLMQKNKIMIMALMASSSSFLTSAFFERAVPPHIVQMQEAKAKKEREEIDMLQRQVTLSQLRQQHRQVPIDEAVPRKVLERKEALLTTLTGILQEQNGTIKSQILPFIKRVVIDNTIVIVAVCNSEYQDPKLFARTSAFVSNYTKPSEISLVIAESSLSDKEQEQFANITHALKSGLITRVDGKLTMQYLSPEDAD
jgi:hypothetical protein